MTLSETLIAAAAIGLLLVIAALGISWVRGELKHRQVRELLATLDEALTAYHEATGEWPLAAAAEGDANPPNEEPPRERPPFSPDNENQTWWPRGQAATDDGQSCAEEVVAVLQALPPSRAVLERIPQVLRVETGNGGQPHAGKHGPWKTVRDAWGQPLRCITAASPRASDRQMVQANGGRPLFISAGPDGRFGLDDPATEADNLFRHPSPHR